MDTNILVFFFFLGFCSFLPLFSFGFIVQGQVLCQVCERMGSWSLLDAQPLVGAKVGIKCRDYRYGKIYSMSTETNYAGWYYEPIRKIDLKIHHIETPADSCTVHLISSDDQNCNVITNVNFGLTGASVRFEKTEFVGTREQSDLYSPGILAFRPKNCFPAMDRYN